MATEFEHVIKKIGDLREELRDLIDYLDLLEAREQNLGEPRYSTEQVKKILRIS